MRWMYWGSALFLALSILAANAGGSETVIPESFPKFLVPGHQAEMDALRQLMWLHSQPPAGPLATLWDDWMSGPTLWPALAPDDAMDKMRERWRNALSGRIMDPEGYVATHQHGSVAHQLGWPFPFWAQGGAGAWGWHFSLQGVPPAWHGTEEKTQDGWLLEQATDQGIHDAACNLSLIGPCATAATPPLDIDVYQAPFMQLRWKAAGLGLDQEFFESLLVPQIILDGFLGFRPTAEGFSLNPNLPSDWPELTVTRIYIHDRVYDIHITPTTIQLNCDEYRKADGEDFVVTYPLGKKTDRVLPGTTPSEPTITLERKPH